MTEALKIGIAGLGTVGASVFRLLTDHAALLSERAGRRIEITAVSARNRNQNRGVDVSAVRWHDDPVAVAADPEVDVVVELIGGASGAAFDLLRKSLELGKPFITANKALLATRGAEVLALARKSKSTISFEAAVAGGIPVIKGLREGLAANRIRAVYGILNGTCNYILSEMTHTGRAFAGVLKEAQEKGFAEADPGFDVDGIDAAHKVALLSSLAFSSVPDAKNIEVKGIRSITPLDIAFAGELGYRVKLLGITRESAKGLEQSVEPCLVPKDHPIAAVDGVLNAVYVDGDYAGKVLFVGAGAGGDATASAVVADIIDVARGRALPLRSMADDVVVALKPTPPRDRMGSYFIRMIVLDQPGVIADISAILRNHRVSLESVLQRGRDPDQPVPVIMTTHETSEECIRKVVEEIGNLKAVTEPPHVMRIETFDNH